MGRETPPLTYLTLYAYKFRVAIEFKSTLLYLCTSVNTMAITFTPAEISQYLHYLELPAKYKDYLSVPKDIEFLRILQVYQIARVPYENLALHYSRDHQVIIDPRHMYNKIMSGRGRGGYCMELCVFYYHILLALGFNVYQTGIRIRLRNGPVPFGDYIGLQAPKNDLAHLSSDIIPSSHTCNIVTFDNGDKYAVDVSFGGDGPTQPMKLVHGEPATNLGSQQVQLTYESISPQFVSGQKHWIYQYRNQPELPWNHYYCFNETEFLYGDLVTMNWYVSTFPNSFQNTQILAVKFLRDEEKIVGKVMLVNREVKKNMGGRTELVKVCETERDRIEALEEYFDIILIEEERVGIKGRVTDLEHPQTETEVMAT
jgi:arylamine N-acetyltransferase